MGVAHERCLWKTLRKETKLCGQTKAYFIRFIRLASVVHHLKTMENWCHESRRWRTGFLTSRSLAQTQYIFHRYSRAIHTATIREIIRRSTAVLARTRISRRLSISCMQQESRLSWMVYLTMWDAASGHFRMYLKIAGIPRTKTGSISASMAIPTITMDSGMRAGKETLTLSN